MFGYLIYSFKPEIKIADEWRKILFVLMAANLADIDYLFGFFIGKPNAYHHQFTHSFLFGLIVSILLAFVYNKFFEASYQKSLLLIFMIYSSHLVIDFLTMDTSFPYGEQIFWPFSNQYYLSPVSIFRDVQKGQTTGSFFQALFSGYNFITILSETVIFVVFALPVYLIKKIHGRIFSE